MAEAVATRGRSKSGLGNLALWSSGWTARLLSGLAWPSHGFGALLPQSIREAMGLSVRPPIRPNLGAIGYLRR